MSFLPHDRHFFVLLLSVLDGRVLNVFMSKIITGTLSSRRKPVCPGCVSLAKRTADREYILKIGINQGNLRNTVDHWGRILYTPAFK